MATGIIRFVLGAEAPCYSEVKITRQQAEVLLLLIASTALLLLLTMKQQIINLVLLLPAQSEKEYD